MNNTLDYIAGQLKALTAIPSPTSFTKAAADYLLKVLREMGYEPELSNKGNVFVTIGGSGSPLILAAHIDTLGAMVRSSYHADEQASHALAEPSACQN